MTHVSGDIQCDHCGKESCEKKRDEHDTWHEPFCDDCKLLHWQMEQRHIKEVREFEKFRHVRFEAKYGSKA